MGRGREKKENKSGQLVRFIYLHIPTHPQPKRRRHNHTQLSGTKTLCAVNHFIVGEGTCADWDCNLGAVGVICARADCLSAASHVVFRHAVRTCSQLGEEHEMAVHPVEWGSCGWLHSA